MKLYGRRQLSPNGHGVSVVRVWKNLKQNKMKDKVYDWMIRNLPFRWMYINVQIDSTHKMWLPRWGWSKRQMVESEMRAEKLISIFALKAENTEQQTKGANDD